MLITIHLALYHTEMQFSMFQSKLLSPKVRGARNMSHLTAVYTKKRTEKQKKMGCAFRRSPKCRSWFPLNTQECHSQGFHSSPQHSGFRGSYRQSCLRRCRQCRSRLVQRCRCGQILRPAGRSFPCYPNRRR